MQTESTENNQTINKIDMLVWNDKETLYRPAAEGLISITMISNPPASYILMWIMNDEDDRTREENTITINARPRTQHKDDGFPHRNTSNAPEPLSAQVTPKNA